MQTVENESCEKETAVKNEKTEKTPIIAMAGSDAALFERYRCTDVERRLTLAGDPLVPAELLAALSRDMSRPEVRGHYLRPTVASVAAANPSLPLEEMERLVASESLTDRLDVAKNPALPLRLVGRLLDDENVSVRTQAARHPRLTPDMLELLLGSRNWFVRKSAVANLNATPEMLAALADDEDVQGAVAGNPNTPVEVLLRLAEIDEPEVREGLSDNPKTPAEVLLRLATDEDDEVRLNVACNPNVPLEALHILEDDFEDTVANAAREWLPQRFPHLVRIEPGSPLYERLFGKGAKGGGEGDN